MVKESGNTNWNRVPRALSRTHSTNFSNTRFQQDWEERWMTSTEESREKAPRSIGAGGNTVESVSRVRDEGRGRVGGIVNTDGVNRIVRNERRF